MEEFASVIILLAHKLSALSSGRGRSDRPDATPSRLLDVGIFHRILRRRCTVDRFTFQCQPGAVGGLPDNRRHRARLSGHHHPAGDPGGAARGRHGSRDRHVCLSTLVRLHLGRDGIGDRLQCAIQRPRVHHHGTPGTREPGERQRLRSGRQLRHLRSAGGDPRPGDPGLPACIAGGVVRGHGVCAAGNGGLLWDAACRPAHRHRHGVWVGAAQAGR
ncbi:hypothetical protein VTN96DRAFT_10370 [Rasamsonia emersonii]